MSVSRQVLIPGAGVQAARSLMLIPLRALQTPMGRRLMVAGALTVTLQGAVGVMYSNADSPGLAASAPAAAAVPAPARPANDKAGRPVAAKTPEAAAVAWFAARHKLDPGKVRALQRDAVGDRSARVLVMADLGHGRLDTAVVTVERTKAGWARK
jgi:hypothetical protein